MTESETAFSTFENKWISAYPEARITAIFLPERQRQLATAFYCLIFELEQTTFFSQAAPQVAVSKLAWWAEELSHAMRGQARHPITQALFVRPEPIQIPSTLWQNLENGALLNLQEDRAAPDLTAQIILLENFYSPVSQIEAQLLLGSETFTTTATRLWVVSTLLRKLTGLSRPNKLPSSTVPLLLMARYQLTQEDLRHNTPQSHALFNDYLGALQNEIELLFKKTEPLSVMRSVRTQLDSYIIRRARKSTDPLHILTEWRSRIPLGTVWYAWQAARRRLRDRDSSKNDQFRE